MRPALLTLLAIAVPIGAQQAAPIPTDGLVAHWALDGNADDSVGEADGVVKGTTATANRFGEAGKVVFGEDTVDFSQPFRRLRFMDALAEKTGTDLRELSREELLGLALRHGLELNPKLGWGRGRAELTRNFEPGDRAVICSTIGCGTCSYCRAGYFAQCDKANPNGPQAGTAFFG